MTEQMSVGTEPDPLPPPFGPTLALTVLVAVGLFLIAAPLALVLIPATRLPAPFGEQHQTAETLLFLLAFAVALPISAVSTPRIVDRIAAGPNAAALSVLAASLTVAMAALILGLKASGGLPWGDGLGALLAVAAIWFALAALALSRAMRGRRSEVLLRASGSSRVVWGAAGLLTLAVVVAFTDPGSISLLPLVAGAALVAIVLVVFRGRPTPRLSGGWGILADATAGLLLFLAVPNLVIFGVEGGFEDSIIQFHQDFFLGPANNVLGGGAILVDTLSQYGVGSIYFLAGWFQIAPIGYGTLSLIEGLLSASVFVAAYVVLRLAGASRVLAGSALAVAVVALVYGLLYVPDGLLQHGSLRFGLPMGVILAGVAEARWPQRASLAWGAQLLIVAVSSIWALEAFAYTILTLAGITAVRIATLPASERRAALLKAAAGVVVAILVAHVTFAAVTLTATGQLPDWGMYATTLRAFLVGKVGDLTYDFAPWSPAILVGALYLASAAGILLLLGRRRGFAREGVPLIALAGATAYGVALFSYFVNRSADHILAYVCLPAIMVGALWLSLLLRRSGEGSPALREGGLAFALSIAVLMVALAWSSSSDRFSQSALALAAPGGKSLPDALDRLWDFPPVSVAEPEAQRLLEQYMPDESRSLVLTSADLSVEVLFRSGRTNRMPLSDPWEDSFVPVQHLPDLRAAVAELEAGDRALLDRPALEAFQGYIDEPARNPLTDSFGEATIVPTGVAVLQEWVLKQIGMRFELRAVARGEGGLVVVELVEL